MPSSLVRTLVPVSILFAVSLPSLPNNAGGPTSRPEPVAVITGRVVDSATSQPLAGTVVSVRQTTLGVQTDSHGNYRLNVPVDSVNGHRTRLTSVGPGTADGGTRAGHRPR